MFIEHVEDVECDHHIDHNETYCTISERTDELFIFFK